VTTNDPESASQDAFLSSLPGSHQAPLMGFPKNAPPSGSALVVHSCFEHLQLALSGSRLRLVLARGQVLFRLRGFPPPWRFSPSRVSRVFCTPQPIMGFAALGLDSQDTEMSLQTHLSATPHPSKHLHVCSFSTGSFYKFPGSPEILPSCCSPSENGSTSRLSSADRVREVLWCCHLVPRTASLGFSFKSLWVELNWKRFDLEVNPFAPVGEPIDAQLSLVFFLFRPPRGGGTLHCCSAESIFRRSFSCLVLHQVRPGEMLASTMRESGGSCLAVWSDPIGTVRWTAETVTKLGRVRTTGRHA
jgi:hypothetical protein